MLNVRTLFFARFCLLLFNSTFKGLAMLAESDLYQIQYIKDNSVINCTLRLKQVSLLQTTFLQCTSPCVSE